MKKSKKHKKRQNIPKKNAFIKGGRSPGVLLSNFEGVPGFRLLNFEGSHREPMEKIMKFW